MKNFKTLVTIVEGRSYLNVTPHELSFLDSKGELVIIPTSGIVINARPIEKLVLTQNEVEYVTTVFESNDEGSEILNQIDVESPGTIVIGSILAAQAYPGKVVGMVPVPGFERVPPAEKRMRLDKFTIFV